MVLYCRAEVGEELEVEQGVEQEEEQEEVVAAMM